MSSCFCLSSSDAVLEMVMELTVVPGAVTGVVVPVVVPARWMAAFLCESVTTVMDRLFRPGSMYVSFTHTMPSSTFELALTLDDAAVTGDEDDMGADVAIAKPFNKIVSDKNRHPSTHRRE